MDQSRAALLAARPHHSPEGPPGILRKAAGASYQQDDNLAVPLGLVAADGFALPAGARATAWADVLEMEGATPMASYDHRHFGRFAAATTHRFGKGRVTSVSAREGRRLWFVSSWAWKAVTVPTPVAGVSLLSGRDIRRAGRSNSASGTWTSWSRA